MVDGLLRFGRQKFGDPEMPFEEVSDRFAAEKVFEMPPVGRLGMPRERRLHARQPAVRLHHRRQLSRRRRTGARPELKTNVGKEVDRG